MNAATTLFRLAQRVMVAVVLVVSGAYLLVYLYRWEWNRAIISGIFFIAAEIAMAASSLSGRLRRLEEASAAPLPVVTPSTAAAEPTAAPQPAAFRWLVDPTRMGVFIPILLGAGVILSALAYAVERAAQATTRLWSRPASQHADLGLQLPDGGLLSDAPKQPGRQPAPRSTHVPIALSLVTAVVVALIGWSAMDHVRDATQSRPNLSPRPAATTVELQISTRGAVPLDPSTSVQALWATCRSTIAGAAIEDADVLATNDPEVVDLVLRPGISDFESRRLTGCLTDATLDRVVAQVVAVTHDGRAP